MISRVLVVGLGSIGRRHLRLARECLPHADIRVLRHRKCVEIPEDANGCFSCIEDALSFAPEIAVIAGPASFHVDVAQPLAAAGVHLLVEKPLSASLDGVPLLLETCRDRDTVLLTGYNLRFLPSLRQFRELLNGGMIGRVLSVRCEIGQNLPAWRPDADYRQSVSARRELGGGALLELSHELDYLRWIFGEIEWVNATLLRQSAMEIDVEDSVHLILGFVPDEKGNRIVGTANLDFIRHDTTRLCTAIGEKGSLRWNGLTGTAERFEAGGEAWQEVFRHQHQRNDSYLAEWLHFLACVEGMESPLISGTEGLQVLRTIEAARQSSIHGIRVQVEDIQMGPRSHA